MSLPWAAPPPRETASEFRSAGLTFPRRPAAVADYQLASAEGPLRLPLKLSAGRLPHWDVVAIAPRGPDALLLSFGRGDAAKPADSPLCFGTTRPVGDGWAPIGYSLRRPPESPAPNYTRHDECEIAPETRRRLSWKPVDGKWLLTLTAPDAATISLGWLDERGLAIDQPARVRPVLLSRDEVEFEFDGRVWRKPKGGRLDQFRLIPDARLRPSRLAVDEAGRMRHWTDAVPTLSDPSLGAFATEAASGDDKYSPDTSVQAVVRGDGPDVTLTLTSKASHGGDGLDLSARATGADGKWRFPFQQPQEVVMASDEMLVLRDESSEAVWRLSSEAGETPASLLKILNAANMCESLRRSGNKNR
ncbi:MAG TPA: hypothetical protein PLV92_28635, partial [Pirellulaceae bacterium]|nr:hypothetical protein [Pirellulaceae bacterium]